MNKQKTVIIKRDHDEWRAQYIEDGMVCEYPRGSGPSRSAALEALEGLGEDESREEESPKASKTIQGTVAVLINRDGKIVISAADFGQTCPGGYTVQEAQQYRLKQAVVADLLDRLCHSDVVAAFDSADRRSILERLIDRKNYRIEFVEAEV